MFGKRFNFLTIAGLKIGIDISWFFIAFLLAWSLAAGYFPFHYHNLSTGTYWLMGIIGMLGLFVCVVLHELGHAFVAKYFKLPISQITLFIFGGIAEIKKEPSSAKVEFLMTIAGPIVSVLLAIVMYLVTLLGTHLGWPVPVLGVTYYLAFINLILAIFNLVPAFPLDGGRILRAILWWWKNDLGWATRIATRLGSGFGLALIFFGILLLFMVNFLTGFWLIIIGWFLHRAATENRSQFYVRKELEGAKVAKFMTKNPIAVPPDITLQEFIDQYVYQSHHHLYPVAKEGRLIGYISFKEVKMIPHAEWKTASVQTNMVPRAQFQTISPETSALEALDLIQQTAGSTLLVESNHQLVGILTAQDLFKVISLKLELEDESR